MKIYKYRVIRKSTSLSEAQMNEFGRRGYELTGVLSDEWGYTYYFKIETNE